MNITARTILGAGMASLCLLSVPAKALTFTNSFVASDWGSNITVGQDAVIKAETTLSSIFTNNVNVSINFDYGSAAGDGAYAQNIGGYQTGNSVVAAMRSAAGSSGDAVLNVRGP